MIEKERYCAQGLADVPFDDFFSDPSEGPDFEARVKARMDMSNARHNFVRWLCAEPQKKESKEVAFLPKEGRCRGTVFAGNLMALCLAGC
jgi:hypothetical protein